MLIGAISMNIYESTKATPYIYICIHKLTGEFYWGYREANILPSHLDFPIYKTSAPKIHNNFDEYDWYIIAEFYTGDDAYDAEQQMIFEAWGNPLLLNKSCYYGKIRFNGSVNKGKPSKRKGRKFGMVPARQGIPNTFKGKQHSEKSKQNMRVPKGPMAEEHKLLLSLATKGTPKGKQELLTCPHCNKTGGGNLIKRWHFNNCKLKTPINT
jgi:hypothetical protein